MPIVKLYLQLGPNERALGPTEEMSSGARLQHLLQVAGRHGSRTIDPTAPAAPSASAASAAVLFEEVPPLHTRHVITGPTHKSSTLVPEQEFRPARRVPLTQLSQKCKRTSEEAGDAPGVRHGAGFLSETPPASPHVSLPPTHKQVTSKNDTGFELHPGVDLRANFRLQQKKL